MEYFYYKCENSYLRLKKPLNPVPQGYEKITERDWEEKGKPAILDFSSTKDKILEIKKLKSQLQRTDYQAIKYAEGLISAEDYEQIKTFRQGCRNRINELEEEIANAGY